MIAQGAGQCYFKAILDSSTPSLMIWMMAQIAFSTSLQMIEYWEEWLIHEMVVLPFRGTLLSYGTDHTGTS